MKNGYTYLNCAGKEQRVSSGQVTAGSIPAAGIHIFPHRPAAGKRGGATRERNVRNIRKVQYEILVC